MRIRTFSGNFFEIGKQQGDIYRRNGMSIKTEINQKLFKGQLRIYKKHYPELIEEFRGMAEAGKFDKNRLIYKFITGEIIWFKNWLNPRKACTIFGVRNKNGTFVGRNYDWHPVTERVFEAYRVVNPKRNSFIALTDMGISGQFDAKPQYLSYNADDAINDKGLFIGLTFAYNNNWSYGLSCSHMIKLIAETCSTVEDTLTIFRKTPLCCPKNFFIADRKGHMAVVEHTSKRFKVVYPENDILIQTNHYVDSELSKEDAILKYTPAHNTFLRYYEVLQKINMRKSQFNSPDVMKILGNTESCVCQNHPSMKTVWSLSLDPKRRKYRLYWDVLGKRKELTLKV